MDCSMLDTHKDFASSGVINTLYVMVGGKIVKCSGTVDEIRKNMEELFGKNTDKHREPVKQWQNKSIDEL